MKTIGDMQNEKYFYDHYKMFVSNHDFVISLKYKYIYTKIDIVYLQLFKCNYYTCTNNLPFL